MQVRGHVVAVDARLRVVVVEDVRCEVWQEVQTAVTVRPFLNRPSPWTDIEKFSRMRSCGMSCCTRDLGALAVAPAAQQRDVHDRGRRLQRRGVRQNRVVLVAGDAARRQRSPCTAALPCRLRRWAGRLLLMADAAGRRAARSDRRGRHRVTRVAVDARRAVSAAVDARAATACALACRGIRRTAWSMLAGAVGDAGFCGRQHVVGAVAA